MMLSSYQIYELEVHYRKQYNGISKLLFIMNHLLLGGQCSIKIYLYLEFHCNVSHTYLVGTSNYETEINLNSQIGLNSEQMHQEIYHKIVYFTF